MKLLIILIFTLTLNSILLAQISDSTFTTFENDDAVNETNIEYFNDRLLELQNNQINVNKALYIDLAQIPYLSHQSILAIINYRNEVGKIKSLNELFNIEDLNYNELINSMPYITLYDAKDKQRYNFVKYQFRMKKSDAYSNSPDFFQISNKLFLNENQYSINLLQNKNYTDNKFFNIYSISFQYNDLLWDDKLLIGDYKIKFGKGLVTGNGYFFKSILNPMSDLNFGKYDIIKNSSLSYSTFNRGISYSININQFSFTSFFSKKFLSYKADSNGVIQNIYTYPAKNNYLFENKLGFMLNYDMDLLVFSFLYYNLKLNHNYKFNQFKESEKLNSHTFSFYINYLAPNYILNYEIALQKSKYLYEFSGSYSISKKLEYGINIIKSNSNIILPGSKLGNYYKPLGNFNFYYNAISYKFDKQILNFYSQISNSKNDDFTRFIQEDNKISLSYFNSLNNKFQHLIAFSYKYGKDYKNQNIAKFLSSYKIRIIPSSKLNYTTEIIFNKTAKNNGYAFSEYLNYNLNSNISIKSKISYFSVNNFDSAIFSVENDMDGNIIPNILSNDGFTSYIICKYYANYFSISLKYFYKMQNNYNSNSYKSSNIVGLQIDYRM